MLVRRDLKPENILLGGDGHLLLTDFGLSKMEVTCFAGNEADFGSRADSMVGTKEYVAPEVVKRKSYGKAVDWWAVGVLFYELLHGHPPFEPCKHTGKTLFQSILSGQFEFEERTKTPPNAQHLIRCLLQQSPDARPGPVQIKSHPFFKVHTALSTRCTQHTADCSLLAAHCSLLTADS